MAGEEAPVGFIANYSKGNIVLCHESRKQGQEAVIAALL